MNIVNNSFDRRKIELTLGYCIPKQLIELLSDDVLMEKKPVRFRLKNHSFILELQYILDVANMQNYDIENSRVKFAVTTDGFDLLVDLNSVNLDILQDEFGEVDSLEISLQDLIESDKEFI